jgi:hypothetical protein
MFYTPYNETPTERNAMQLNPLKVVKFVTTTIVGAGTATIVKQVISNNTEAENIKDQITIPVASLAIGGMVAEASKRYTDHMIDEAAEFYNQNIKPKLHR